MDINKIDPFFEQSNPEVVDLLENVAKTYKPDNLVFPVGFPIFDYAMDGGVRSGELITVSAMTGHGKTTFCQQLTENFTKNKVPCLWFSFEMNPYYLNEKFVQMGVINHPTYTTIKDIYVDLSEIESIIKNAYSEHACKIVFIDHLHYLVPLKDALNVSLMVGGLVRKLKTIAVKNDVIIFLVAHTKKLYQGENLDLSSIRDSSLIAQESDYVFLIERLKKTIKKNFNPNDTEWTNETKITLAKNRRTGELRFITCEFQNKKFVEKTNIYDGLQY
jgi:replicative DNA helicase